MNRTVSANNVRSYRTRGFFRAVFTAVVTLSLALAVGCSDDGGGDDDGTQGPDPDGPLTRPGAASVVYTGTAQNGTAYSLKVVEVSGTKKSAAAAAYAPKANDAFELTTGSKKSTGFVSSASATSLTLKPSYSTTSPTFTATVSGADVLTGITGTITFTDGSTAAAPGSFAGSGDNGGVAGAGVVWEMDLSGSGDKIGFYFSDGILYTGVLIVDEWVMFENGTYNEAAKTLVFDEEEYSYSIADNKLTLKQGNTTAYTATKTTGQKIEVDECDDCEEPTGFTITGYEGNANAQLAVSTNGNITSTIGLVMPTPVGSGVIQANGAVLWMHPSAQGPASGTYWLYIDAGDGSTLLRTKNQVNIASGTVAYSLFEEVVPDNSEKETFVITDIPEGYSGLYASTNANYTTYTQLSSAVTSQNATMGHLNNDGGVTAWIPLPLATGSYYIYLIESDMSVKRSTTAVTITSGVGTVAYSSFINIEPGEDPDPDPSPVFTITGFVATYGNDVIFANTNANITDYTNLVTTSVIGDVHQQTGTVTWRNTSAVPNGSYTLYFISGGYNNTIAMKTSSPVTITNGNGTVAYSLFEDVESDPATGFTVTGTPDNSAFTIYASTNAGYTSYADLVMGSVSDGVSSITFMQGTTGNWTPSAPNGNVYLYIVEMDMSVMAYVVKRTPSTVTITNGSGTVAYSSFVAVE